MFYGYDDKKIDINIGISSIDGRCIDNYGKAKTIDWLRDDDNKHPQKITDYLACHARKGVFDRGKNKQTDNYIGGKVKEQKSKNTKTKILNFNIVSDSIK